MEQHEYSGMDDYSGAGLGRALKADLDRLGITQDEIGELFGKSQQSVSKWIAANRVPQAYWAKLVERLGTESAFTAYLKSRLTGGVVPDPNKWVDQRYIDSLDHEQQRDVATYVGEGSPPVFRPLHALDGVEKYLPVELRTYVRHPTRTEIPAPLKRLDYVSGALVLEVKQTMPPTTAEQIENLVGVGITALSYARAYLGAEATKLQFCLAIVVPDESGSVAYHEAVRLAYAQSSALEIHLLFARTAQAVANYIIDVEHRPQPS